MRTAIVVDDEPITRMDLAGMLTEQGFTVVGSAADGFDAIELCRTLKPDVVLMDIKMPIFDGLSASETIIREEIAGCVVLLTAYSGRELIERANQVGVTGYLVKPVEERLLLPTIEVALAQSIRLRVLRQEARTAQRQLEESKYIERAKEIIAKENSITEGEAYRQLRQMSMDKRCPVGTLAKAVVENHSQKELVDRAKALLMKCESLSESGAYKRLQGLAKTHGVTVEQAAQEVLASIR